MIAIQYDFFKTEEECKIEALERMCLETKASSERVRKGIYAKSNAIEKRVLDLEGRLSILERNICHQMIK